MLFYQYARTLSLDVVLGSVAGASLAATVCGNLDAMPWSWWLLLPLIVWLIYTSDHLLDARRIGPDATTHRHRFHYRHFRGLTLLVLLGALAAAVIILRYLPARLLAAGLWLGAGAMAHLACAQWTAFRAYPAEAVIALLYTAGIWFGPVLDAPDARIAAFAPEIAACVALFALSAFTNLLVFSLFERQADARESPNRMVIRIGARATAALLYGCVGLATLLAGFLLAQGLQQREESGGFSSWIALLLYGAVLTPPLVYRFRDRFARNERYRSICDGVFILYGLHALLGLHAYIVSS